MSTKKFLIAVVALCVLFAAGRWLHLQIAYAAVEQLTEQHGGELSAPISQSIADDPQLSGSDGFTSTLEYFKVFEYSESQAKVLVVVSYEATRLKAPLLHDRLAQFRYFVRQGGAWVVDHSKHPYELVWDDLGSADDETWSPYH